MDESLSLSSKMDSDASKKIKADHSPVSKRRKTEKKMVSVKIKTSAGKAVKNEGPPSDSWSWRKYGQKTIKGSPYPRGYYRCSTSKGCLAKKQVERCRTDASMVIITYTCSHNHPGPENSLETHEIKHLEEEEETLEVQNLPGKAAIDGDGDGDGDGDRFHYIQSPTICSQLIVEDGEEDLFAGNSEKTTILLEEKPISCSKIEDFSKLELSEENDFFDELEELPAPPSFTSFLTTISYFSDERIPVAPSVISGTCFQI